MTRPRRSCGEAASMFKTRGEMPDLELWGYSLVSLALLRTKLKHGKVRSSVRITPYSHVTNSDTLGVDCRASVLILPGTDSAPSPGRISSPNRPPVTSLDHLFVCGVIRSTDLSNKVYGGRRINDQTSKVQAQYVPWGSSIVLSDIPSDTPYSCF